MSIKERHLDEDSPWRTPIEHIRERLTECYGLLRLVSFWTAIAIPFVWVVLLYGGISTTGEFVAFAVLLVTNVFTLVVGHAHRPGMNATEQ